MKILGAFILLFFHLSCSAILLEPEDFGAIADDGISDTEAFQAMFDAISETERNVLIRLYPGTYDFDKTVYYPKYNRRRILIEGNNASLKAMSNDIDILAPEHADARTVAEALFLMDKFVIEHLGFEGGATQLTLTATLNSELNNCEFMGGETGADLIFCLMARIVNCQFTAQTKDQLLVRSGQADGQRMGQKQFTNATGNNSQSNVTTIEGCRFFAGRGCFAQVRNYASNSMSILNTVFEGNPPQYAVHYDDLGSTTCTYFTMHNVHIELPANDPTIKSLIKSKQQGGVVHLDGVYSQTIGAVHVEAGNSLVKITNWPYLPVNLQFKAEGGEWIFEDVVGLENRMNQGDVWVNNPPAKASVRFGVISTGWINTQPEMKTPDGYFRFNGERINHTAEEIIEVSSADLYQKADLNRFEIGYTKRYLIINEDSGERQLFYLPILIPKDAPRLKKKN